MDNVKDNNINNAPEVLTGRIENSNDYILHNITAYLQYVRETVQRIIKDDNLKYSEPRDKKKEYPEFTYIQFQYILQRLHDEIYNTNLELLYSDYINHFSKIYDMAKVKLCYTVYQMLCAYYGFICSLEGFYLFSGIDEPTLKEWLSTGRSDVYKIAVENSKNAVVSDFENSKIPILKLAAGNYKYKLNTPINDRQEAAAVEVLPDLLSIEDHQKALQELPKQD